MCGSAARGGHFTPAVGRPPPVDARGRALEAATFAQIYCTLRQVRPACREGTVAGLI